MISFVISRCVLRPDMNVGEFDAPFAGVHVYCSFLLAQSKSRVRDDKECGALSCTTPDCNRCIHATLCCSHGFENFLVKVGRDGDKTQYVPPAK